MIKKNILSFMAPYEVLSVYLHFTEEEIEAQRGKQLAQGHTARGRETWE